MEYNFDQIINRKGTDSFKWKKYGDGILPMWVADMDFLSAEPIRRALRERAEEGIYGYTRPSAELHEKIQERLVRLYHWEVWREEIFFIPSIVIGLNASINAFAGAGDAVVVQPPVYHHFVKDPILRGRILIDPPLVVKGDTYEIDYGAFERAITPATRLFILCNPHNPVGRVFTVPELEKLAEICLRHRLIMCADEIHCDLIYPGHRHTPLAALSPEIAASTLTLMSPSKTYNLPGLGCGFVIIRNPSLQKIWENTTLNLIPRGNIMGFAAAQAAFTDGQEWLDQVLVYLRENRDFLARYVRDHLPGIAMAKVEGTYLAWLDCRRAGIAGNPFEFFLQKAKVALNDGADFGRGGEGFIRLNFACPRKTLEEAVSRMAGGLRKI